MNYFIFGTDSSEYMGTPRNLKVQPTVEGYLVTWEPPDHGREHVRIYIVRWFRGPLEHLYGKAETTDTYFLGESKVSIFYKSCS